ncbi:MAG TPA: hypothetical protein VHY48_13430 [Acidobacteriaceae bacterium]|jgi:predicted Fe-S protein YdhL (DUF1289 family)|nr:hypothetical protein [Acidobacteriaceae bacterium]
MPNLPEIPTDPKLAKEWLDTRIAQMKRDWSAENIPEYVEDIVKRLGYPTYQDYLRSPLWLKVIRPRILNRDDNMCYGCEKRASEVHHRSYTEAVIRGNDDSQLFSLCRGCHEVIERYRDGKKLRPEEKHIFLENLHKEKLDARRLKAFEDEIKAKNGSRCYWCKGDTDIPSWGTGGRVCVVPTEQGDDLGVWMCLVCYSTLKRMHGDKERLEMLRHTPKNPYSIRRSGRSILFPRGFDRLNAMQREELVKR